MGVKSYLGAAALALGLLAAPKAKAEEAMTKDGIEATIKDNEQEISYAAGGGWMVLKSGGGSVDLDVTSHIGDGHKAGSVMFNLDSSAYVGEDLSIKLDASLSYDLSRDLFIKEKSCYEFLGEKCDGQYVSVSNSNISLGGGLYLNHFKSGKFKQQFIGAGPYFQAAVNNKESSQPHRTKYIVDVGVIFGGLMSRMNSMPDDGLGIAINQGQKLEYSVGKGWTVGFDWDRSFLLGPKEIGDDSTWFRWDEEFFLYAGYSFKNSDHTITFGPKAFSQNYIIGDDAPSVAGVMMMIGGKI